MKKLNVLVLRTFIGPFILTFILILFFFVMQFVWKYLDDIVGKGLEWYVIAELIVLVSTHLVAATLPLAILLSSIMTFGNLAENYELAALKSAGISIFRVFRPLIYFVIVMMIGSFIFSNYITPVAELKYRQLLWDVVHQKPILELKEGAFYRDLDGFALRVSKKNNETNRLIDVLIYDHRKRDGNRTVIRAKEGMMEKTTRGRYMKLTLFDGISYDEQNESKVSGKIKEPELIQTYFEKNVILFDLSSFQFQETDEERWSNKVQMLNMIQLSEAIDSLNDKSILRKEELSVFIDKSIADMNDSTNTNLWAKSASAAHFDSLNANLKKRTLEIAQNMTTSSIAHIKNVTWDVERIESKIVRFKNEFHRKIVIALACILFFFIGAPFGAIIKKGGLGWPVVLSIFIFLIYHISSISGEKMIKQGILQPFEGMWLSSFVLFPIGVFLTYKAAKDAPLFEANWFNSALLKLRSFKKSAQLNESTTDLS